MKLVLDNDNRNIIGPRLKVARLKNNLTQQQLSAKLETMAVYIDRASISKIEQQKRIVTDYELLALCEILKVSVNWLLGLEK
ncbi:MAG: family transcriptional regulator [Clostridia bacterium]|jgi:transcriptional regulator with XRE-family HTH domain|uniref:helix-turn-helix domain-containing protein n=1 Tax=Petroclostridium xylanilyticum TaxID=1792311 RepID=UPI000B99949E|nr:helix-turn-helix transcriptional regulator [Petroclostridium xylanilyticum]MBZ4647650.1 family transcriptional regulator [Clostridia bacterium]